MRNSIKRTIKRGVTFSSLTMASIYCLNKAISLTASAKNILTSENGNYFDWRYGSIYYTKSGSGSPVLFIHDLSPESSSYEWNKLMKKMQRQHTVYTIDLLGCGRSDKPNLTYTSYMYVQLITDFIKKIIGEKTDVVVSGYSASFVIMACKMNSEHFKKVIMLNPPELYTLNQSPTRSKNMLKLLIELPFIGTLVYNIEMMERNIAMRLSQAFYKSHIVPTKLVHAYYEGAHLEDCHGKYLLSSIRSYYTNINITNALKQIDNSLYIIESHGHRDAVATVNDYMRINPSIESIYLPKTCALPQLEAPEKTFEYINVFLQSK